MNARPKSFLAFCQPELDRIARESARLMHQNRKTVIDRYKAEPSMFWHAIRPSLTTQEAIEDATRIIFRWRNLSTWTRQNPARLKELEAAKMNRLAARYFRRFPKRIGMRDAA